MSYKIEIIRKEEHQTNTWAGGTTTQLAIYPKDAIYSERDFKWRLSSAKVKVNESVFTSLPNIDRVIMVIEGDMTLEHEGHHTAFLKPFEQDSFSGSWITKSFGKVTDFNLMMAKGCEGALETIHLEKSESKEIFYNNLVNKIDGFSEYAKVIYCVNGCIKTYISTNEVLMLSAGDILILKMKDDFNGIDVKIHNEGDTKADLIIANIKY